jgi:integrase
MSGLRVNELRHLAIDHLDLDRYGFWLDAEWTKNRKSGFQPLPVSLVERLHAFVQSDEVKRLYARFYGRKDATLNVPDKPLLYVPILPARALNRDLQTAGIQKQTASGKLDFHSLRVTYINLVIESGGVSVKEAQELARHATPELTMNVYGRTREERLSQAVEKIAQALLLHGERATYVHQRTPGTIGNAANPSEEKG